MKALIISAPHSGAGKTMITLGLLRALRDRGVDIASAKSGPDYIDPQFHRAATGASCVNLDAWAMSPQRIRNLAATARADLTVVEGAMGLFDGAPDPSSPLGRGATADVAKLLGVPVVLVLDVAAQAQSAVATAQGFSAFDEGVRVCGVILNRVGSPRHAEMIKDALDAKDISCFGAVPRLKDLETPSRHLGLVQAGERDDLEDFITRAGAVMSEHLDLDGLLTAAETLPASQIGSTLSPLGQRIAVAQDAAFGFSYPHLLDGWRQAGAELLSFSPLAGEGPDEQADAVFLPGGYPELHGGRISECHRFRSGMASARDRGALIYGECGGYMTLGEGIVDAEGVRHRMLGLLPLETTFADRKLHLGYRELKPLGQLPWSKPLAGHEFHYAKVVSEGSCDRLFEAADARGTHLGAIGLRSGRVMGSFAHVIDGLTSPAC